MPGLHIDELEAQLDVWLVGVRDLGEAGHGALPETPWADLVHIHHEPIHHRSEPCLLGDLAQRATPGTNGATR